MSSHLRAYSVDTKYTWSVCDGHQPNFFIVSVATNGWIKSRLAPKSLWTSVL